MTCPRCQGLMVGDLSCDLAETQGMGEDPPMHELWPCDRSHNRETSPAVESTNGGQPDDISWSILTIIRATVPKQYIIRIMTRQRFTATVRGTT